MQCVDIITSEMHQVHGANRITEKLVLGREIFNERGYELRYLLTQDGVMDCKKYNTSVLGLKERETNYRRIRFWLDLLKKLPIYRSYLIQKIVLNRSIKKNSKVNRIFKNQKNPANVIVFQDPFTAYIVLRKNSNKICRSILISHAAEDPLEQLFINRPELRNSKEEIFLRNILKFVFSSVSTVVTICRSSQEYMLKTYGLDCPCIINGIEDVSGKCEPKLSESDNRIHLAIVASVQYRKGQDIAIKALSELSRSDQKRIQLHLVGDGNGMADIRKEIESLNLKESVVLHGQCLDVSKILAQMDGFILPSRADTVPVAIIEAMRAGLPIFATNVGEVPYMIGNSGVLFKPSTEDVLEIFTSLLSNSYNLKEMGKEARQKYLSEFNLRTMINRYCDVLQTLKC